MPQNIIAVFGKSRSGKNTVGDMIAAEHAAVVQLAFADRLKQMCGELFGLSSEDMNTDEGKARPLEHLPCLTCPRCGSINARETRMPNAFESWDDESARTGPLKAECRGCGAVGEPSSFKGFWTPRMILQHVATEGVRRVDPMAWARHTVRVAGSYLAGHMPGATDKFRPSLAVITDGRFRSERAAVLEAGGEVWRIRRPVTDSKVVGIPGHASEVELDGIPDSDFTHVIMNDGTLDDLRARVRDGLNRFRGRR